MIVLTISAWFSSTGIIGFTFLEVCPDLNQCVSWAKSLMKDVPVCGKGVPRNDCSDILSKGCITALLSESSTGVDTYPCKQLVSRGENKGFLLKEIQTYQASSLSAWGRRRGFSWRRYRLTQQAPGFLGKTRSGWALRREGKPNRKYNLVNLCD